MEMRLSFYLNTMYHALNVDDTLLGAINNLPCINNVQHNCTNNLTASSFLWQIFLEKLGIFSLKRRVANSYFKIMITVKVTMNNKINLK